MPSYARPSSIVLLITYKKIFQTSTHFWDIGLSWILQYDPLRAKPRFLQDMEFSTAYQVSL